MPSFLTSEPASDHIQNSGVVHLDAADRYCLSRGKVNGRPALSRSGNSNDSFDESSSHSTNISDMSDSTTRINGGDSSDATTLSTALSNGTASEGGGGVKTAIPPKPAPNGDTSPVPIVVGRAETQQQPLANGTNGKKESGSAATSPKDAQGRTSMASTGASSVQTSPVEMYIRQVSKGDVVTVDSSGHGLARNPSSGPATSLVNLSVPTSTAPGSESSGGRQHSPHRVSAPPLYHSTSASASLSSPANLHPHAGLKHRHTLEVPKLAPARTSRDGIDSALASGRFSPTTATGFGGGRRASLNLVRRNTRSLQSDQPRDEVVPDEDALRWAEAYRQKRASKRRRMEQDDDRVLVGTRVDETHANFVTAYNMLTGIRVSVSRTNAKLDRPLTDADFGAKQKSTFDIAGNELVPSAKYDFKFKDYAPWVFRHLRALFRLDPADYLVSLTGKYILSELGSPGKSGSFFYFSRDYKYIIKTIHHAEHKFLRKILKDYYEHVTENPNTLLSQFYGLHRVKIPYGKKIHFVVMNNLFPPHRDIHQTFDLKGSTIGRSYKEEDLEKNPRATLKDLNWLRRHQHLEFGLQKKRMFLEQLHKDVRLLQKLHIMDYSLLIGIHDLRKGNEENLRDKTLQVFNPGGENSPDEYNNPASVLMRTPSKLENQRKARELRQMIKAERPVPIGQSSDKILEGFAPGNVKDSVFYKEDGGFQATHENNDPGEEVYYLGVIDCLTHYGVIKKIEHFWKGLSNDRNQISALPPQQYGERFLNFMSGVTMSPEAAATEAETREQAAAAAADQGKGKEKERGPSWSGSLPRRSTASQIPAIPQYQPPPPPSAGVTSGHKSPEADAVMRRAEQQAERSIWNDEDVPETTLLTTSATTASAILPAAAVAAAPSSPQTSNGFKNGPQTMPHIDRRESAAQTALPVVEEAGEGSSTGGRSRNSNFSSRTMETDSRPLTPAKDGEEMEAGFGNPILSYGSRKGASPLTPPKSSYLKPESADSGYGVTEAVNRSRSGTGGSGGKVKVQLSRESLDKELPPLPRIDGAAT